MKVPPASTAAFVESVRLLLELHELFAGGLGQSQQAEAIRDAMERPWYDMTDDEQGCVEQLSADLYTIGDRSVGVDPGDDLRAALRRARAAGDAETVLALLQEHAGLAPPAERSRLRGEAWVALGVPQAASLFIEDAIRATSPPAPSHDRVRPRFPRLRRITEAASEDRLRDPFLSSRRRPVALVTSFETEFDPPDSLSFDQIVRAPERLPSDTSARLRAVPVDAEAWEQALNEIDHGVGRAAAATGGDLHVFATMPYPAAVYLGRRLDDRARARLLHVHQLDPVSRTWVPFSSPASAGAQEATPFFEDLEALPFAPAGEAVILAIEGMRPISDEALHNVAVRVQAAAIYRLRPRSAALLRAPAEVQSAVASVRSALLRVQAERPLGPSAIHVVATAPVALLIELGRLVVPTVYKSVIMHQFDPQTAQYVPVLDVITRRVM